jgi:hypothetical protein
VQLWQFVKIKVQLCGYIYSRTQHNIMYLSGGYLPDALKIT